MNTGKIIQKCRWSRGLSQDKLSDKSGVPRQTISSVEIQHHSTSVAIFVKLLNAMDYDLVVIDRKKERGQNEAVS